MGKGGGGPSPTSTYQQGARKKQIWIGRGGAKAQRMWRVSPEVILEPGLGSLILIQS